MIEESPFARVRRSSGQTPPMMPAGRHGLVVVAAATVRVRHHECPRNPRGECLRLMLRHTTLPVGPIIEHDFPIHDRRLGSILARGLRLRLGDMRPSNIVGRPLRVQVRHVQAADGPMAELAGIVVPKTTAARASEKRAGVGKAVVPKLGDRNASKLRPRRKKGSR